jgi:signal transduction histidine kinase
VTRRLVASYVLITAFALVLLAIPLGLAFARNERESFLSDIEADADSMAALAALPIYNGEPVPRADIVNYAQNTGGHVIVVDADGIALLDTDHPDGPGVDYSTRPEIQDALRGQRVEGRRYSDTAGTTLLYAAVPTSAGGEVNGAVRITYRPHALDARVRRVWAALALLCAGVLLVAAIVAIVVARSIVRPVRRLEEAANELAQGDLDIRADAAESSTPELRSLATSFNEMADHLTRLINAQQRFVADASHQLRTPFTGLRLRLENLQDAAVDADRPALDAAAAEVARLSRLVDGLLVLARGESDASTLTTVDVARIVVERGAVWTDVARERSIDVTVTTPDEAWATAPSGAIEQIVDNLVDNALTVSRAGNGVTLRVERLSAIVVVHVIDEGPGLEPEAREQAFDRFWRAADAPPGGSGLGLAIVRRLAEAGGGTAWLDPSPAGGIDASVSFRAAERPDVPADAGESLTWR